MKFSIPEVVTELFDTFRMANIRVTDVVEIIILSFLIYEIMLWIKKTRAWVLLKGFGVLLVFILIAIYFEMNTILWLAQNVFSLGVTALLIVFQPELRKALEQLGRGAIHKTAVSADLEESGHIVSEITSCLLTLSRRRVGALIVIEQRIGLKDVIETGTSLNSQISAALLDNIFEPNTPLHDGAVVIRGPRIMAAACILSLSEGKGISRELGTRHRAALGVTETTDAISLIVSEETGTISVARNGRLTRHLDRAALEDLLLSIYHQKETGLWSTLMEKTKRRKGGAE